MSNWIQIAPENLHTEEREEIAGVEITLNVSPFDVPSQVRGRHDNTKGIFVIELEYSSSNEPKRWVRHDSCIRFHVGQHSGCVYCIELNTQGTNIDSIHLKVEVNKAIDNLVSQRRPGERQKRHYNAVKGIIDSTAQALVSTS